MRMKLGAALVLFVGVAVPVVLAGSPPVLALGKLLPGESRCFEVSGDPGDVALANVTPVQAEGRGYGLLVSSDVTDIPVASNVNFEVGTTDPNVAATAIGADGRVCYVNSEAVTHLVADHLGTIDAGVYTVAQDNGAPLRRLDTRGGPLLAAGERRCFSVAGSPGDVALVNLTPVQAQGRGYGLLVSSDVDGVPVASSVNFGVDTTDPNVAAAAIGADGQVCYLNSEASSHLVADHLGTIDAAVYTAAQGNGAPLRKLDTRGGPLLASGARRCFAVAGSPGDIALVNLTPVQAEGRGYGLLVSSDVAGVPEASNVNFAVATTDPNVAAAVIGADGQVCYLNSQASAHLAADHLGTLAADAYTAAQANGAPLRKLDTRGEGVPPPGPAPCSFPGTFLSGPRFAVPPTAQDVLDNVTWPIRDRATLERTAHELALRLGPLPASIAPEFGRSARGVMSFLITLEGRITRGMFEEKLPAVYHEAMHSAQASYRCLPTAAGTGFGLPSDFGPPQSSTYDDVLARARAIIPDPEDPCLSTAERVAETYLTPGESVGMQGLKSQLMEINAYVNQAELENLLRPVFGAIFSGNVVLSAKLHQLARYLEYTKALPGLWDQMRAEGVHLIVADHWNFAVRWWSPDDAPSPACWDLAFGVDSAVITEFTSGLAGTVRPLRP